MPLITDPGAGGVNSYAQRLQAKGMKGSRVVSVNMHHLGESFVEKVSDVRRRATVDGEAAAPGESLEFLAHNSRMAVGGPKAKTGSAVTTE
jgi:hypothetical protein